ncbi:MAG: flagellar biosynthetic protein FliR [Curvibacter sp.]|nr:flagellar biosynthetic protein FliR [Curvibacter sp.]
MSGGSSSLLALIWQAYSAQSFAYVGLLSVRIAIVMFLTPLMLAFPVPGRVKVLLGVSISVCLAQALSPHVTTLMLTPGQWIEAFSRETALGLSMATGVLMAFSAFSMAGQLMDLQIGLGIAQVLDPGTNRPSPIISVGFSMLGVLLFFLLDGHHAMLRGLAYSVDRFPVGAVWKVPTLSMQWLTTFAELFGLGFVLVAPAVLCLLVTEVALGIVARNLPQINMLTLGVPLKLAVGLALLALWLPLMGGGAARVYKAMFDTWTAVFAAADGASDRLRTVSALMTVGEVG